MLHINDLRYRIGGTLLLDGATLAVAPGHRVGLVGRNGAGKTTLLRLITGEISADGGSLRVRGGARIGTVAQEAPGGERSAVDAVLAADTERSALLDEADHAVEPQRIADIHNRLAEIGAESAPARAAAILAGLGFDTAAQARPCGSFSGGLRMRIALAAVLFSAPDLLLLDEPTNHLDLESSLWLETFLTAYRRTVLIVSHDRDVLNKVVNRIAHLDGGKLQSYTGGYDQFERLRAERMAQQKAVNAKLMAQRRHIEAFVNRFRAQATKARQAQSRIKALARMAPIAAMAEARTTSFTFPDPGRMAPPLITLDAAAVGYAPDVAVLRGLDLRIDPDDRIALLGANGNGKSTLVRLLAGRLQPMAGQIRRAANLRIGYFAQHQSDELSPARTAFQHLDAISRDVLGPKLRAHLGRFGLTQKKADVAVADLSGGEKARLLFALMSWQSPQVMLLDEPTNHLDIDAREALVQALNAYEGAVILISHDRHLVDLCADRLWLVADGTCAPYDGDLDAYRAALLEQRRAAPRRNGKSRNGDRRATRRAAAEKRAAGTALRKRVRAAETAIKKLQSERAEIDAALADPALYDGPPAAHTKLARRKSRNQTAIAAAEAEWLAAEEASEGAAP